MFCAGIAINTLYLVVHLFCLSISSYITRNNKLDYAALFKFTFFTAEFGENYDSLIVLILKFIVININYSIFTHS